MHEFRITKYDPALRDSSGAYLRSTEWTSKSHVGKTVTFDEYMKVESAYLDVALAFFEEAGIDDLAIHWELTETNAPTAYIYGDRLRAIELRQAMQRVLREEMWAQFGHESGAFLHFGYDYYMYLGVPVDCPKARALAAVRGLFVEPFISPYHPEPEESDGAS